MDCCDGLPHDLCDSLIMRSSVLADRIAVHPGCLYGHVAVMWLLLNDHEITRDLQHWTSGC